MPSSRAHAWCAVLAVNLVVLFYSSSKYPGLAASHTDEDSIGHKLKELNPLPPSERPGWSLNYAGRDREKPSKLPPVSYIQEDDMKPPLDLENNQKNIAPDLKDGLATTKPPVSEHHEDHIHEKRSSMMHRSPDRFGFYIDPIDHDYHDDDDDDHLDNHVDNTVEPPPVQEKVQEKKEEPKEYFTHEDVGKIQDESLERTANILASISGQKNHVDLPAETSRFHEPPSEPSFQRSQQEPEQKSLVTKFEEDLTGSSTKGEQNYADPDSFEFQKDIVEPEENFETAADFLETGDNSEKKAEKDDLEDVKLPESLRSEPDVLNNKVLRYLLTQNDRLIEAIVAQKEATEKREAAQMPSPSLTEQSQMASPPPYPQGGYYPHFYPPPLPYHYPRMEYAPLPPLPPQAYQPHPHALRQHPQAPPQPHYPQNPMTPVPGDQYATPPTYPYPPQAYYGAPSSALSQQYQATDKRVTQERAEELLDQKNEERFLSRDTVADDQELTETAETEEESEEEVGLPALKFPSRLPKMQEISEDTQRTFIETKDETEVLEKFTGKRVQGESETPQCIEETLDMSADEYTMKEPNAYILDSADIQPQAITFGNEQASNKIQQAIEATKQEEVADERPSTVSGKDFIFEYEKPHIEMQQLVERKGKLMENTGQSIEDKDSIVQTEDSEPAIVPRKPKIEKQELIVESKIDRKVEKKELVKESPIGKKESIIEKMEPVIEKETPITEKQEPEIQKPKIEKKAPILKEGKFVSSAQDDVITPPKLPRKEEKTVEVEESIEKKESASEMEKSSEHIKEIKEPLEKRKKEILRELKEVDLDKPAVVTTQKEPIQPKIETASIKSTSTSAEEYTPEMELKEIMKKGESEKKEKQDGEQAVEDEDTAHMKKLEKRLDQYIEQLSDLETEMLKSARDHENRLQSTAEEETVLSSSETMNPAQRLIDSVRSTMSRVTRDIPVPDFIKNPAEDSALQKFQSFCATSGRTAQTVWTISGETLEKVRIASAPVVTKAGESIQKSGEAAVEVATEAFKKSTQAIADRFKSMGTEEVDVNAPSNPNPILSRLREISAPKLPEISMPSLPELKLPEISRPRLPDVPSFAEIRENLPWKSKGEEINVRDRPSLRLSEIFHMRLPWNQKASDSPSKVSEDSVEETREESNEVPVSIVAEEDEKKLPKETKERLPITLPDTSTAPIRRWGWLWRGEVPSAPLRESVTTLRDSSGSISTVPPTDETSPRFLWRRRPLEVSSGDKEIPAEDSSTKSGKISEKPNEKKPVGTSEGAQESGDLEPPEFWQLKRPSVPDIPWLRNQAGETGVAVSETSNPKNWWSFSSREENESSMVPEVKEEQKESWWWTTSQSNFEERKDVSASRRESSLKTSFTSDMLKSLTGLWETNRDDADWVPTSSPLDKVESHSRKKAVRAIASVLLTYAVCEAAISSFLRFHKLRSWIRRGNNGNRKDRSRLRSRYSNTKQSNGTQSVDSMTPPDIPSPYLGTPYDDDTSLYDDDSRSVYDDSATPYDTESGVNTPNLASPYDNDDYN